MSPDRESSDSTLSVPVDTPRVQVEARRNGAYFVVFDQDTSWRFVLPDEGAVVIGRGTDTDLRLRDSSVSRHHARIEMRPAKTRIVDLGSHNGVLVNRERIPAERPLRTHDVVTLGHVTLVFHAAEGAADEPTQPTVLAAPPVDEAVRRMNIGGRAVIVADPAMTRVYALLERLAASDLPVLVCGETGTGKELAAAAVHSWSPRAGRPLVAINCAAIPADLAESELFGHEKGAFSGAQASKVGLLESARGGTVFLDEIGELSSEVQAKLLRVLDTGRATRLGDVREREIDIRIVAATNADLEADVLAGSFRSDLYFRLSGATIWLPPLRDRGREVVVLAEGFLAAAAGRAARGRMTLSSEAVRALGRHRWPGNVRELKHVMEFLAATVPGSVVEVDHVLARLAGAGAGATAIAVDEARAPIKGEGDRGAPSGRSLDDELRDLERRRIGDALTTWHGNQTRAAESLGMPRRTFVAKLKAYGLARRRD